jgi:EAL domain-containing protein (putative c-di-GMP-specific phosphodiesterase class I)
LTALVLDTALAQRRTWADAGLELGIAVNVSARSLADRSLADRVTRALLRNRCPSDALTIEITESQLMADPARAADALRELHDLGVRISIDDFGTGYSSLSYFKKIPADELKIDKSFVMGMLADESDQRLVETIITLAHQFRLDVVAEGVNDHPTLGMLARMGCDHAQGHLFAPALNAEQLGVWLRGNSGRS